MHYLIFRNMAHYAEAPHDSLPYHPTEIVTRLCAMTGRDEALVRKLVSDTRSGNHRKFISGNRGKRDALLVRIVSE
jgi:hypothetical protein